MKNILILIMLLSVATILQSNNLHTVTNPTAGVLSQGESKVQQLIYKNNGMMIGANVGLFENFQFGVTYGAENIVGDQEPNWNRQPGFNARLRIINETLEIPAIAIGVETQGFGAYYHDYKRYDIKSKGAYLVASKNFGFLGMIGFDFGTNYTFEKEDDKTALDFFVGMYKTLGPTIMLFSDFSLGLNDNCQNSELTGKSRGYLNSAVHFRINDQLTLKLLMKDLLRNRETTQLFDRSIMIDYRWFF
jgi:hypothetical protein